MSLYTSWQ